MSYYDSNGNRQENRNTSCTIFLNSQYFLGASSLFHKIKNNLTNLVFLGKDDGIDNKSKHKLKYSAHTLDPSQSNENNQVYDAPTLELNITNEIDNPIHLNTNINMDYVGKNMNDTRARKFSLDSSRINQIRKKPNAVTRIVHYITGKKFETKEKNDHNMSLRNSSFTSNLSAFKPIDNRSQNINLNSKKIINYNDFFEVLKDKKIVKPVAVRKSSSAFSQLERKRNRPLENSFILQEEEKSYAHGQKMRKITDDDRSLFSSVQNLNKIRNMQRDDVSMKSLNSVMSYKKFINEDKEKNILQKNVNDDVSMNFIIPENKSVVRSYYSKTLEEIKSEIEQKRGKGTRMYDEVSKKSRKSREEMKMDYDEKKKFLSNYYKEKEKNFKEIDLLNKNGKISLDESDLNKDRNLSYSKSSMMIESAPKKDKHINIVESSNFDICSNKEEKPEEVKEIIKEKPKTNQNINHNMFFGNEKPKTLENSNALTDKKINLNEKKLDNEKSYPQPAEGTSSLFTVSQIVNTDIKDSDASKSLFGLGDKNSNLVDKKSLFDVTPTVPEIKAAEKIQDNSGLYSFGKPPTQDLKSGLFAKIDKKEDTVDSALFFGAKKEGGLFEKLNRNDDSAGSFKLLSDKNEDQVVPEKDQGKTGFFNLTENKEQKASLSVAKVEKNEDKQALFGLNKIDEQKTNTTTNPPLFGFEQEKKTEPEQKSTALFSNFVPKINNVDKPIINEISKASEEKLPLFANEETKPISSFAFPTQMNIVSTSKLGNNLSSNQFLFGNLKNDKEDKSTTKLENTANSNNLFDLGKKAEESKSASILFGNIQVPTQTSFLNEPPKQAAIEASSLFLLKDPPSTSLVNDSNPFLQSIAPEKKVSTLFMSPNKPGINIFNFVKADGTMNNSTPISGFNSGLGINKISSSSINNSNRSNDMFENADKGATNKGLFSSGQNFVNTSNPFIPRSNNAPKNDIFSLKADSNDTMAISPIQSPKMMPKNDAIKNPNQFLPIGNFGANSVGIGGIGLFNSGSSSIAPTISMSNSTTNNNLFGAASNSAIFGNPSSTQNMPQGNTGLFGGFNLNNMNSSSTGMFGSSPAGSGLSFNIGKKK